MLTYKTLSCNFTAKVFIGVHQSPHNSSLEYTVIVAETTLFQMIGELDLGGRAVLTTELISLVQIRGEAK